MVHVEALPGTPQARLRVADIAALAVTDARAYASAGFDALILENMHDRPYLKGAAGPEIVAAMTAVAVEVRRDRTPAARDPGAGGANCEAMAVAHACRAAFVRVEGFVFAHVADEGLIEACAGPLLRYRKAIGADGVRVFADIKKKHSAHAITGDVDLVETARAAEFFTADGVIVSGRATGRETDAEEVRAVSAAVGIPTFVGSGITVDNLSLYPDADGLIVGSAPSAVDGGPIRWTRSGPRNRA